MNSYIMHFTVYSMAMIGFIGLALYIYKKSMFSINGNKNKDFLKVENMLRLSASKNIYVLKAGNEKFLIAGDSNNTTMLAKLENTYDNSEIFNNEKIKELPSVKNYANKINRG